MIETQADQHQDNFARHQRETHGHRLNAVAVQGNLAQIADNQITGKHIGQRMLSQRCGGADVNQQADGKGSADTDVLRTVDHPVKQNQCGQLGQPAEQLARERNEVKQHGQQEAGRHQPARRTVVKSIGYIHGLEGDAAEAAAAEAA